MFLPFLGFCDPIARMQHEVFLARALCVVVGKLKKRLLNAATYKTLDGFF